MGGFALGGRFTTLEGLMTNIEDQVTENPLMGAMMTTGDSASADAKLKMDAFKTQLGKMRRGEEEFTIVLNDPAGNSYLQDLCLPAIDPQLTVEHYERDFDQNDDLGLNDMKTENYEDIGSTTEQPKD